jgi:cytochrome b561
MVYDRLSVVLHWTVAALVFVIGGLGLLFDVLHPWKPQLLNAHAFLGLVLIVLVFLRALHRLRRPAVAPAAGTGVWSKVLAAIMHEALYVLLVAVPVIGLVSFIWHARTFHLGLIDITPVSVASKGIYHPTQVTHIWLAYALMGAGVLHAVAALWHHLVRRDATLTRMIPGLSLRR